MLVFKLNLEGFEVSISIDVSLKEVLTSYVCDCGCHSSASVTGLNNNEYQIGRGKVHADLSHREVV